VQALVVPPMVKDLLSLKSADSFRFVLFAYKLSGVVKINHFLRDALLPAAYKARIRALDKID
jgi:hypothetical protein